MPDQDSSVVSEALPAIGLYVPTPSPMRPSASAREKLHRLGPASLSNTDLVTVILSPLRRRVVEQLLRRYGLAGVADLTLPGLTRFGGLGQGSALRLASVLEIARRLKSLDRQDRPKLTKPREVFDEVKDIGRAKKEHLVGLYLDAQNTLLHRETLSVGSLNTTRTHPREILYPAIQHLALGFILAHNHPSGSLEPSPEDIEFSRSVQRAGELMGIELYDHLIVSSAGFTSLREMGTL